MIHQGHVLDILPMLDAGSVQCCVTSPPYWGLRDYGLEPFVWGGDPDCAHDWQERATPGQTGGKTEKQATNAGSFHDGATCATCATCGAWRGQLGLEPTPDLFVEHLVAIFREVRRVLRDDGVLWLNLGDSYAGASSGGVANGSSSTLGPRRDGLPGNSVWRCARGVKRTPPDLKPKDLVGIPWRVAFALQADGWWLRQDIIWHKPNPMPESVRDRCTKAHEYIFMLTKSARYYYDADAVAERSKHYGIDNRSDKGNIRYEGKRTQDKSGGSGQDGFCTLTETRNLRSVWEITTKGFPEAHFAVFPEKIPALCIRASSKEGDIVLDPFLGSGTTALVAEKLGRRWIGIEANPDYIEIANRRLAQPTLWTGGDNDA